MQAFTQVSPAQRADAVELSIVMPCLNEALTVERCIEKAQQFFAASGVLGEVVIADNGSTDGSQALAQACGARVVNVLDRGYGAALMGESKRPPAEYVIMGDADDSYDFTDLYAFVEALRQGNQLVMGNRFKGGIYRGAMPWLNRYLGNPVLSFVGKTLFSSPIGDFHCGMRGFSRAAILDLGLTAPGMEFASEMVVKATLAGLSVSEVPTTLKPDGRNRPPHLRRWRDGWRHLRFMLLFAPKPLFFIPGLILLLLGLSGTAILTVGQVRVGSVILDTTTLLFAAAAVLMGAQLLLFYGIAKKVANSLFALNPQRAVPEHYQMEPTLVAGALCMFAGFGLSVFSVVYWGEHGFYQLDPAKVLRISIPATTLMILGMQILFSSLLHSMLYITGKIGGTKPKLVEAVTAESLDA